MRAVDGLGLEVSLGTWEPDPYLYHFFAIQNKREKMIENWVRLPRLERDLETQTTTALKRGSEDSPLSRAYTLQVWS